LNSRRVTTEAPEDNQPAKESQQIDDIVKSDSEVKEEGNGDETPAVTPDSNPLHRLRNRQRPNLQVKPKVAASAPVQVRRVNPLLARRRPGAEAASSTTEAAIEDLPAVTDVPNSAEVEGVTAEQVVASSTSTTTEEPRGLSKLLAGRRRLASRQPGTIA